MYIKPQQIKTLFYKNNCIILNIIRKGIYSVYSFLTPNGVEMQLTTKTQKANTTLSLYVININNNKLIVPPTTHYYKPCNVFTDDNETNLIAFETLQNVILFNSLTSFNTNSIVYK